jgi:hypothetical protein
MVDPSSLPLCRQRKSVGEKGIDLPIGRSEGAAEIRALGLPSGFDAA